MSELAKEIWQGLSHSAQETEGVGAAIARQCRGGDIIALVGPLGAGKTQFVRGMARGLGLEPTQVASPTFVLVHEYERRQASSTTHGQGADQPAPVLVHIDAYRLRSLEDLESMGWDIYRPGAGTAGQPVVLVVEWADRIAGLLEERVLQVHLSHTGENQREIRIQAGGDWHDRLAQLRKELAHAAAPGAGSEAAGN